MNQPAKPAEETPPAQTSFLSPEQAQHFQELKEKQEAERAERVNVLSQRLSQEAIRRHGLRQSLEERWLEDLQQFNGVYDATTMANIVASKGSQAFINITRPKVKTAAARLSDMLFPTDDRNWDISPTPVPELSKMLGSKRELAPLEDGRKPMVPDVNGQERPATEADKARMILEKAKEAARNMALEIDDQLTEALYPSKCRRAIHDACLFGTGVVKGPVVTGRTRRKWSSTKTKNGQTVKVLEQVIDTRPGVEHVDLWNFFPNMSVSSMSENDSTLERMYFTKNQLLKLARQPGYIPSNVLRAASLGAKVSQLTRPPAQEKRDSANADGAVPSTDTELYEGWEYHGPLEPDDLRALGVEVEDEITEPLEACVVFVGQVVIKAYINPLETGDHIYHVFVYERDESSIFGFGVAYRMRHSQRILNASVRALMDNAALSTGPQYIIAKRYVQPMDGNWTLTARKGWEMTDATKSVRDVMASFNIDSHQVELQAIIQMAERFADTETNLPLIAQGDQGTVTKTLGGMSLLNNNANVITRDTVKNWDDGITSRLIRAMYDWNMQNSEKEHIKGDFEVDARGSSVLLSKEIQAQNLMALGANYAGHPVFGPMTKHLELYRKIVNAMHVSADDVVVSDDDFQSYLANQKDAPPDPAIQIAQMRADFEKEEFSRKMQMQKELEDVRHQNRMMELGAELQGDYVRYASQERIKLDELKTILGEAQITIQGKRQIQMDKMEFEKQNPKPEKKPSVPGGKK